MRTPQLDSTHVAVTALKQLLPEAMVAGGSFAGSLPHPSTLPSTKRAAALAAMHDSAVELCIRSLLLSAGLSEEVEVPNGHGGEREWPTGFVGSLTHKGTVVLGVIAKRASVPLIGIDLERLGSDLLPIENLITAEGLPHDVEPQLGLLLAFSAKEAVFKAQYPQSRLRLDFSGIQLAWGEHDGHDFHAEVYGSLPGLRVRCRQAGNWVLSAAIAK